MMLVTTLILALLATGQVAQNVADDAYLHYMRASYYLHSARPQEALGELRQAIEADPGSSVLRVTMGKVLLSLNQRDGALAALEKAVELDAGNTDALRLIGRILIQRAAGPGGSPEDIQNAERSFKLAHELDPDDRESLFFLALIYDRMGRIDEAIEAKRLLLSLDPSMRDIWIGLANSYGRKGNRERELEALDRAVALDPTNVDLMRRAGETASELRRFREAASYYDRARERLEETMRVNPDEPGLRMQLAQLYLWDTRQYDLALGEFSRVLELTGADGASPVERLQSAVGRATALYFMEDYHPAAELYEQNEEIVLTSRPESVGPMLVTYAYANRLRHALDIIDDLEARVQDERQAPFLYRLRAQVLNIAGRGGEADLLVEKLISQHPEDSRYQLLLFNLRMERKEYEAARTALESLELYASEKDRMPYYLGLLQWQTGDLDSARASLTAALENDPDDHQTLNNLGYLLAERGTFLDEALGYIQRALEMQPHEGSYLDSLGWVYYKLGNLELAEKHLTAAVRTQYRSAEVREHLGYLQMALNHPAEALAEFQAALALNLAELKSTTEVEQKIAVLRLQLEKQR